MIQFICSKIQKFAGGKSIGFLLPLAILLMVIANMSTMPINSTTKVKAFPLDSKLYYTSGEAYQVLQTLHPIGRHAYMKIILMLDLGFPLIYSICLAMSIAIICRKAFPHKPWLHQLLLLPLVVGVFDYLENISIITMIVKYPKVAGISFIAGYFTLSKWMMTAFCLLIIVIGLGALIWNKRSKGRLPKAETNQ